MPRRERNPIVRGCLTVAFVANDATPRSRTDQPLITLPIGDLIEAILLIHDRFSNAGADGFVLANPLLTPLEAEVVPRRTGTPAVVRVGVEGTKVDIRKREVGFKVDAVEAVVHPARRSRKQAKGRQWVTAVLLRLRGTGRNYVRIYDLPAIFEAWLVEPAFVADGNKRPRSQLLDECGHFIDPTGHDYARKRANPGNKKGWQYHRFVASARGVEAAQTTCVEI